MKRLALLSLGAGLAFCVLVLPNHPGTMRWSALNRWPLELPVILLLLIAAGKYVRGGASAFALLLVAVTLMKVADYGTFSAYNRTFNPILDLFLIQAGLGLLRDSLGPHLTIALTFVTLAVLVALFFGLRASFKTWQRVTMRPSLRVAAALGAVITSAWAIADAGHHLKYWRFDQSPPGTAWTTRLTHNRVIEVRETTADLGAFRQAAQRDPIDQVDGVFDLLAGRDVLLIWVESYGRASFDNPAYAATHIPTLTNGAQAIAANGLSIRSGWLTSPTGGGESWLAHGALASGLWTSNNGRYNAMIASGQKWLFHFAQQAGYRTVAVMPAITVGWPESLAMGFEHVFPAADIPYAGERFNWVTMPDQYTLATYGSLLPDDPRPDFTQVALISSHAPWTPIPDMLPWDMITDGTEFNDMAAQGPAPRELWKDRDAVRDAYRRSVDYSLQTVFSHIARLGKNAPLVIVAGDHQAAPFVAGSDNRDVPVHMIGPSSVLDKINHWNWSDGIVPDEHAPVRRMDTFRNDFLKAFTSTNLMAEVSQ